MNQLTLAASALVVALLLMLSFNAKAGGGTKVNYAQFSHRSHISDPEKPGCDSCHKFPTANWKDVRPGDAAFPDVAEFPKHESCLDCHRQQFFARQRPAPAICANCHVKVTPRDTTRFVFPSLGDVSDSGKVVRNKSTEFAINFPHEKHEDQECVTCHQVDKQGEVKTKPNSHTVCFSCHNVEAELPPAPSACHTCHKFESSAEGAEYESQGQARSEAERVAPGVDKREEMRPEGLKYQSYYALSGLQSSFTSAIQGRRASRLPLAFISRAFGAAPHFYTSTDWRSPSSFAAITDQQIRVRDDADYSKFQHASAYHKRLPCALCHRRESNEAQPTMPGSKDHLPCAGCHVKQFADRSNAICTNCHTEPATGALKAFPRLTSFNMKFDHARHGGVTCTNCHRPARGGVALTIPAGFNAHATCFQCHGPQAKSGERDISPCGVCHELGSYERATQTARAFRVGFSHAQHNRDERLSCNDCHRVRANQVAAPQALNHHAARRSFSCMSCHNGKRAFGGDDFSVCKRCHQGPAWHF